MSELKIDPERLRLIWRVTTVIAWIVVAAMVPVFWHLDAEWLPMIILPLLCGLLVWQLLILITVKLLTPDLITFVDEANVQRVLDNIKVNSETRPTGDLALDNYVRDYAIARDFWGLASITALSYGFFSLLLKFFG